MKRHGQLMVLIAEPSNLRLAFWKAARSKGARADCRAYQAKLDENIAILRSELLSDSVLVGDYHTFKIHDPKERTICAASFRERVLHHALMNVCEPIFERAAVFDSYACRKGKGPLMAVKRAAFYARRNGWFLKMDIHKYFDSIPKGKLFSLLERKFKDPSLLKLFDRILASYQKTPGCGLPIGNLTSQHFANHYLAPLDRFIKEQLRCVGYIRYMDDFVVWGNSSEALGQVRQQVEEFLTIELGLKLNPKVILNRTHHGMDFLGYRIFPNELRLTRRSKRRFVSKLRSYEHGGAEGAWTEFQLQQRVGALIAFTLPTRSLGFRRNTLQRFRAVANGHEPRVTRRQLEQQRQQRAVRETQPQQSGQRQQQHWFPGCSLPSSTGVLDDALDDPATVQPSDRIRGKEVKQRSGVSRGELSTKAPDLFHQSIN